MSNAANKDGEGSEVIARLNSAIEELNPAIEETVKDQAVDDVSTPDNTTNTAPHLVVVAPDAVNAERMGPRLRAAREAKGWTLETAAKETRIHKDYLGAIEDMMPNLLPGMPKSQSYLRGYLSNYAKALSLPEPQDVVQRFLNECGLLALEPTEEELKEKAKKQEFAQKNSWIAPVVISVALTLIACGAGAVYFLKPWENTSASNNNVATAPLENTVYSQSTVLAPASASDLSLHALTRAWVEVRGSDGTVYLSRELAPGDVYIPRVGAGWTITARDGGAFEWRMSGKSLGPIAEAGLPVYSHAVDEALSRQPLENSDLTN
ncbi:helix-turn-helix domain-containing protein [Hirschia maritima]|uniref:helix-turn-helix domain-containing protein n=1 Tax=Hirschia maritima TaxID=1121961 RepID=UPI00035C482F|nr:helix-turn-helix domain-containing protein [Hirschia maritima]